MGFCHDLAPAKGDSAFSIGVSDIVFGPSVLRELGDHARAPRMT